MGVVKCLQRAKDAVYWPGMSKDITDMILKCETCINMHNSNAKEPMTPGPTPNRPWDILATDLFHWNKQDYLLIVDYYSRFVEFSRLDDLSSKSVINHTKSILARHGIPTDNKRQWSTIYIRGVSKICERMGYLSHDHQSAHTIHKQMEWQKNLSRYSEMTPD